MSLITQLHSPRPTKHRLQRMNSTPADSRGWIRLQRMKSSLVSYYRRDLSLRPLQKWIATNRTSEWLFDGPHRCKVKIEEPRTRLLWCHSPRSFLVRLVCRRPTLRHNLIGSPSSRGSSCYPTSSQSGYQWRERERELLLLSRHTHALASPGASRWNLHSYRTIGAQIDLVYDLIFDLLLHRVDTNRTS